MNLNLTFPGYRSLTPAEVKWAEAFESTTGWKLVGTNAVKDSVSFWKMAATNLKKFEEWSTLVQQTIALPTNKEKLPPKVSAPAVPAVPASKLPLPDAGEEVDSLPVKPE